MTNFWFDLEGGISSFSTDIPSEADIIIVGGGFAGLFLLYFLCKHGFKKCLLIEQNVVGYRASGRSNGQILVPNKEAISNNLLLFKFLSKEFPDDIRLGGGFHHFASKTDARDFSKLIPDSVFLNKSDIANLCPYKTENAIFVPGEGVVNLYKIMLKMFPYFKENNQILSNSCVDHIGENFLSIQDKGIIKFKKLIRCSNDINLTAKLFQSIAVSTEFENDFSFIDGSLGWRFYNKNLIASKLTDNKDIFDGQNCPLAIKEIFSYFNLTSFSQAWSGIYYYTKDNLPLIGPLEIKNHFALTGLGHSGLSYIYDGCNIIKDYLVYGNTQNHRSTELDPRRFS